MLHCGPSDTFCYLGHIKNPDDDDDDDEVLVRESADRRTHRDRDDSGDLIICPMLFYSNGT